MIPKGIKEDLQLPIHDDGSYLYISLPASAIEIQAVVDWMDKNDSRGCSVDYYGDRIVITVTDLAKLLLDKATFDYIISIGGRLAGVVCVAAEVDTAILDVDVPDGYSPNGTTTDADGNEIPLKVDELMICVRGTEGKSLIRCSERTNGENGTGLQHEELVRFTNQFDTYYVHTVAQLSEWIAANVIADE